MRGKSGRVPQRCEEAPRPGGSRPARQRARRASPLEAAPGDAPGERAALHHRVRVRLAFAHVSGRVLGEGHLLLSLVLVQLGRLDGRQLATTALSGVRLPGGSRGAELLRTRKQHPGRSHRRREHGVHRRRRLLSDSPTAPRTAQPGAKITFFLFFAATYVVTPPAALSVAYREQGAMDQTPSRSLPRPTRGDAPQEVSGEQRPRPRGRAEARRPPPALPLPPREGLPQLRPAAPAETEGGLLEAASAAAAERSLALLLDGTPAELEARKTLVVAQKVLLERVRARSGGAPAAFRASSPPGTHSVYLSTRRPRRCSTRACSVRRSSRSSRRRSWRRRRRRRRPPRRPHLLLQQTRTCATRTHFSKKIWRRRRCCCRRPSSPAAHSALSLRHPHTRRLRPRCTARPRFAG